MENATFNSLKDSLVNQAWPDMWKPVLALVLLGIVSMKLFGGKSDGRRYPPGPKPLPFIGNMNLLFGDVLPKKLAEIAAQNKWPVMSFKLVNKQKVYVVSSPELTKEVLVTQGQTFASRSPPTFAQRYMVYGKDGKDTGVLFTHYSPTWRTNRKLMTVGQLQHRKIHGDAFIVDLLQVLYNELETKKGALSRNGEHPFEVRTLICRVFLLRIFLVFMFGPGAEKYGEELNALNDIMFYCLDMSEFAKWFFPHIEPLFDLYWGRYVTRKCMADKFRILKTILEDRSR